MRNTCCLSALKKVVTKWASLFSGPRLSRDFMWQEDIVSVAELNLVNLSVSA